MIQNVYDINLYFLVTSPYRLKYLKESRLLSHSQNFLFLCKANFIFVGVLGYNLEFLGKISIKISKLCFVFVKPSNNSLTVNIKEKISFGCA